MDAGCWARAPVFSPSLLGVSRWNMGTDCLCEVEAGENGQGVFRGSNTQWSADLAAAVPEVLLSWGGRCR